MDSSPLLEKAPKMTTFPFRPRCGLGLPKSDYWRIALTALDFPYHLFLRICKFPYPSEKCLYKMMGTQSYTITQHIGGLNQ